MKNTLLATLVLSATVLTATTASGQVYQWKDENGRTVVSDTPPPGKYKPQRVSGATAPTIGEAPKAATAPASTPAAPKTAAEKEMAFKKRQQESKEKAEKEAKEQAAATERRENCNRAQQALRTLESNQRIATTNEKGEREIMDDKQRQSEADRARKVVADSCK